MPGLASTESPDREAASDLKLKKSSVTTRPVLTGLHGPSLSAQKLAEPDTKFTSVNV